MKFKIGLSTLLMSYSLLVFTGCGVVQFNGNVSSTVKENGLPLPAPHARNTDSTTRKIENAFEKSKDLYRTYIYADRDGSNVILSGIVINEKQRFIASAIANSFITNGFVINRVEIYKPNVVKNQSTTKIAQTKK
ncbi:MAG: hypothetical protein PHI79_01645 [Sulfurovaceae bacterium]|nr:hypothetical protein [Sulfurovaceae bacterium]MDD5548279.1 hypothetical protein [Sulfurovaceae bacterium]